MFCLAKSKTHSHDNLASPPGYYPHSRQFHGEVNPSSDTSLMVKKSWDLALAPLKQLPMNLFIMYMAGNSISIIPIMMVSMLLLRPVKALMSIKSKFTTIVGSQAIFQKFVYFIGNLACLGLALYKCQSMGLLPTHSSDWLDFLETAKRVEYASGGFNMQTPVMNHLSTFSKI